MTKTQRLEKITKEIERCRVCKEGTSGKSVPGEGNADADVVFIGEAPGKQEAKTGRPFVGRSGQLLRSMIREVGLTEDKVYITSPVKYLPDRGTPDTKQITHGKTHLFRQLDVINPKILVLLGNTACKAMLNRSVQTLSEHGTVVKEGVRTYFITIHPAAVLRFLKYKNIFIGDFQKLKRIIS